jgi:Holliday junction resolvase RusA-like endonuclease
MCSGKNNMQITRTGHHYPTKRFQVWRDEVVRQMISHAWSLSAIKPLRCSIRYWPNDKRTRDLPGMTDAIYHCLEKSGVIANDGQIKHGSFTTMPPTQEVKLEITIDEA